MPRDPYEVLGVAPGGRTRPRSRRPSDDWPASSIPTSTAMTPRPRRSSRRRRRPTRCSPMPTGGRPTTATATRACAAAATHRTSRGSARCRTSSRRSSASGGASGARSAGARSGRHRSQGDDLAAAVEIDLAEAARGTLVEVDYEVVARCEHCRGNGAEPGTPIETCARCGGSGQLRAVSRTPFGQVVRAAACDVCHGEGRVPASRATCAGARASVERAKVAVEVPAGIADGQRIRIGGRGHAGRAGRPARRPVRARPRARGPKRFVRDGDDLVTAVDVAAPLAALGTTVEVPTVDGQCRARDPGRDPAARDARRRGARDAGAAGAPHRRSPRRRQRRRPAPLNREQRELLEQLAGSMTDHNLRTEEGVFGKLKRAFGAG